MLLNNDDAANNLRFDVHTKEAFTEVHRLSVLLFQHHRLLKLQFMQQPGIKFSQLQHSLLIELLL
jgi:hypothetical protein